MSGVSTAAHVDAIAASDPHRLAIHDDDGPLAYGELSHRVRRCARMLAGLGLRAGDRVAIGGPGLARQVVVSLAVEGLGGVTASFTVEGDASAAALFRHVQWVIAGVPQDVPACVRFIAMDPAFLAALRDPLDGPSSPWMTLPGAAPVRLARTSGSTGASKFLLQSWRGHDWSVGEFARGCLARGRDDRMLLLTPMLVGGAWPRVSACLRVGAAVLAAEHIVLDAMRPTVVFGLPAHLDWFMNALPAGTVLPEPVATCVAGGSLPRQLRQRLVAALRGPVNSSLGCNEAGPICFHLDPQGIGTLVPGVEVRILAEDGSELPDGQPGILALRTPLVGDGYLEPLNDKSGYRDGWFVTSDVCARIGSDRLQLFGRRDDLIVLAGLKVPASVLEEQLLALPSVAAATVQSVQLDGGSTTLGVAVVLAAGHDVAQARAQVGAALAGIAAMGIRLVVLDQLPRLASGKVDRSALLRRFLALTPS
jgi:2-aminobenzoate-CoA ligase